jgi:hypothetical protein
MSSALGRRRMALSDAGQMDSAALAAELENPLASCFAAHRSHAWPISSSTAPLGSYPSATCGKTAAIGSAAPGAAGQVEEQEIDLQLPQRLVSRLVCSVAVIVSTLISGSVPLVPSLSPIKTCKPGVGRISRSVAAPDVAEARRRLRPSACPSPGWGESWTGGAGSVADLTS